MTDDFISRQAAIDTVDKALTRVFVEHRDIAEKMINKIPSAQPIVDAVPVRHGAWRHYERMLTCSECGTVFYDDIMEYFGDEVPRYCPECGAKMDAERKEE